MATRILAGLLLLTLSLVRVAPAFAHPSEMAQCMPAPASIDAGRTPAAPCHAGDMSACAHVLTCAIGPTAVLPAPIQMRLAQGRLAPPFQIPAARYERLGFEPPTPPPNR